MLSSTGNEREGTSGELLTQKLKGVLGKREQTLGLELYWYAYSLNILQSFEWLTITRQNLPCEVTNISNRCGMNVTKHIITGEIEVAGNLRSTVQKK